jgi:hypothetical protein
MAGLNYSQKFYPTGYNDPSKHQIATYNFSTPVPPNKFNMGALQPPKIARIHVPIGKPLGDKWPSGPITNNIDSWNNTNASTTLPEVATKEEPKEEAAVKERKTNKRISNFDLKRIMKEQQERNKGKTGSIAAKPDEYNKTALKPKYDKKVPVPVGWSQAEADAQTEQSAVTGTLQVKPDIVQIAKSFIETSYDPIEKEWWQRRTNLLIQLQLIEQQRALTPNETADKNKIIKEMEDKAKDTTRIRNLISPAMDTQRAAAIRALAAGGQPVQPRRQVQPRQPGQQGQIIKKKRSNEEAKLNQFADNISNALFVYAQKKYDTAVNQGIEGDELQAIYDNAGIEFFERSILGYLEKEYDIKITKFDKDTAHDAAYTAILEAGESYRDALSKNQDEPEDKREKIARDKMPPLLKSAIVAAINYLYYKHLKSEEGEEEKEFKEGKEEEKEREEKKEIYPFEIHPSMEPLGAKSDEIRKITLTGPQIKHLFELVQQRLINEYGDEGENIDKYTRDVWSWAMKQFGPSNEYYNVKIHGSLADYIYDTLLFIYKNHEFPNMVLPFMLYIINVDKQGHSMLGRYVGRKDSRTDTLQKLAAGSFNNKFYLHKNYELVPVQHHGSESL